MSLNGSSHFLNIQKNTNHLEGNNITIPIAQLINNKEK
jgi:hypothetical protein